MIGKQPPFKKRKMATGMSSTQYRPLRLLPENKENPPHPVMSLPTLPLLQVQTEGKTPLAMEEILQTPFPFGKYKGFPVASLCFKAYYLATLYDKNVYWQTHPLKDLLVSTGVLIENGRKFNPDFYVLCQRFAKDGQKQGALPDPYAAAIIPHDNLGEASDPRSSVNCFVCLDPFPISSVRYAWMPCGHANLCQGCYYTKQDNICKIRHCPLCRLRVNSMEPLRKIFV